MTVDWYEYPGNYSNGTIVDGFGSFIQYSNGIVNGGLGLGIVILIWLASFGLSMAAGAKKALMASSFITLIFSIYLARLDMIHPGVIVTLIIMLIIGALGSSGEKGL